MKYLSLVACLFFSLNTFAARAPRLKEEVAKIAVGPKAAAPAEKPTLPTATPDDSSTDTADATDAVDKPILKPQVIVTDAPGSATETSSEPPDESSNESLNEPSASASATPDPATAKIETSKSKIEILKPVPKVPGPIRVEKAGKVPPTVNAFPTAPTAAATKPEAKIVDGVSAEQSLKWLENGNTRYVTKKFRADGRSEKDRAKKDVKPHAIVLACSDSRVPPELIFDQGLGEITTIRVAGEVLDASVIASIEQTLINEHPHLLVVLGHTQCSAIESTLAWKETPSFGSDALDRMVSEIKPHLKTANSTRSPGLQIEAALQADGVARDLPEHSAIVKKAVESGELTIKTGLYWVDTGKVKFY
jgi:carbonic anhydrase